VEANKKFADVILEAKPELKLYNLLGQSQAQYINFRKMQKWMRKHNLSDEKQRENINNIQFAREFFEIIDDNGSGGVFLDELAIPLISLGLSSNVTFTEKLLKAINPKKFAQGNFDQELTLQEFTKIFKKDQVSERLTEVIRDKVNEFKRKKMNELARTIEKIQK